jgi:hypothetical protein
MKALKIISQWMFLIVLGCLIWAWCTNEKDWHLPVMPGSLVLFFALSLAFLWVEIMKWGVTKPFNCVKCMSGWIALILAVLFHTSFWYLYLPAGLFVGAMYSAIVMRYL